MRQIDGARSSRRGARTARLPARPCPVPGARCPVSGTRYPVPGARRPPPRARVAASKSSAAREHPLAGKERLGSARPARDGGGQPHLPPAPLHHPLVSATPSRGSARSCGAAGGRSGARWDAAEAGLRGSPRPLPPGAAGAPAGSRRVWV